MNIAEWLQRNFDKPLNDENLNDENGIAQEPITIEPKFVSIQIFVGSSEMVIDFGCETPTSRFHRALVKDSNGYRLTYCS